MQTCSHVNVWVALTPIPQPAINRPFVPTPWPQYVVQPLPVARAPDSVHGVVFIPRQGIQARPNRDVRAIPYQWTEMQAPKRNP